MPQSPTSHTGEPDVELLWDQGRKQEAINLLLQRINAAQPEIPLGPGLQLVQFIVALGDLAGAEPFLRRLQGAHPHNLEVLELLAVVLSRQGKARDAVACFEQVVAHAPRNTRAWDGLTAGLAQLERYEDARRAGERSLAIKTEEAQPLEDWQPPAGSPLQHLERPGRESRHDVIAFSLWGSDPQFLRGALRNALLIPELYPGWQARFYLDESVPEDLRGLLTQLGADCRLMPHGLPLWQRACWRLLVANDPGVGRFLLRDCGAVVSQREVAAVAEWQASECWFHGMRDWWTHTEPIPAGLWGGVAGVLPDLQVLLSAYKPAAQGNARVDQGFLTEVLWGSLHNHTLIHDRCFHSAGSKSWPNSPPAGQPPVGQNEYTANRKGQAVWLAGWLQRYPCLQVEGEDPFALTEMQEADLDRYVLARWPGPLGTDPPPAMPDFVSGWVINLDSSTDRWRAMEAQIKELGWGSTHRRFAAHAATQAEAEAVGLPSAGQLGLWRSTKALLEQWLASDPPDHGVLHIIEDDAILHPALPLLLEPFSQFRPSLDLLFTEAFLTLPLYQRLLALDRKRQAQGEAILFLNGGQYLACASSVLLSRNGASQLLSLMGEAETKRPLPVTDMFLRALILAKRINASITLPFFSTIRAEKISSIQNTRANHIRLSQNADLALRRLLYMETWAPEERKAVLKELSEILSDGLIGEEVEALAIEILKASRAKGWLASY